MSSSYSIAVESQSYSVVDDRTIVYWAVITGSVQAEVFGSAVGQDFGVRLSRTDLKGKTTESGLFAITGYPEISFPKLGFTSYTVDFVLTCPGFRDLPVTVTIPAGAALPFVAPGYTLRRLPVRIQGRVVSDVTHLPLPANLVVAVDSPTPPPPVFPHTILLRSPLYFAHPKTTDAKEVTLALAGSASLTKAATAGDEVVWLTNTTGLTGAAFVRLSTPSNTLVEYGVVDHLGPDPGQVVLTNALHRGYAAGPGTLVTFQTATTGVQVAKLTIDADAGDGILVADSLIDVSTVVVDSGSPTAIEYHELGAITDADGYYSVDGVGRVAQLFLRAQPAVPGTPVIPWVIEYEHAVNVVDFRI